MKQKTTNLTKTISISVIWSPRNGAEGIAVGAARMDAPGKPAPNGQTGAA